jgi:hypothetical protein
MLASIAAGAGLPASEETSAGDRGCSFRRDRYRTDDVTIQREREEFLLIGGMPADER